MSFSFCKGSRRNTQCYKVYINDHWFGISYSTVVSYSGPLGRFCRENTWGPTTGRHMAELGCHPKHNAGWTVVSEEDEVIRKATSMNKLKLTHRYKKMVLARFIQGVALRTLTMPEPVGA